MKNAMTTTEHLNLIVQHLDKLLATAEKRTPGKWHCDNARGVILESGSALTYPFGTPESEYNDATFIASCAGNAEAGWRATKAAIETLEVCTDRRNGSDYSTYASEEGVQSILAAFPLELITAEKP